MVKLLGTLVPNQAVLNAGIVVSGVAVSRKITDCPGAILVTPLRDTELAEELELSSIFQPVMSTALVPIFVTSNQSAV